MQPQRSGGGSGEVGFHWCLRIMHQLLVRKSFRYIGPIPRYGAKNMSAFNHEDEFDSHEAFE